MKSLFLKSITAIFLLLCSVPIYAQSSFQFKIDSKNSIIHWKGFKPMGSQSGTIKLLSGIVEVENDIIIEGNFVADMNTITDNGGSAKLEKHLKSVDFFNTKIYPISKFNIKTIENIEGKTYLVGDLTIKNITKQITIPVTILINQNTVKITTETFKIDRTDFNVKYKSKSFFNNLKDSFIRDKFDLQITIIAKN